MNEPTTKPPAAKTAGGFTAGAFSPWPFIIIGVGLVLVLTSKGQRRSMGGLI